MRKVSFVIVGEAKNVSEFCKAIIRECLVQGDIKCDEIKNEVYRGKDIEVDVSINT